MTMIGRTRRAPRWRRRLSLAALCLLFGAVSTVGVAWTASIVYNPLLSIAPRWGVGSADYVAVITGESWVCSEERLLAVTVRTVGGQAFRTRTDDSKPIVFVSGGLDTQLERAARRTARQWPGEANLKGSPFGERMLAGGWGLWPAGLNEFTRAAALGWPCRALWYSGDVSYGGAAEGAWTIPIKTATGPVLLPARIAWPGFIINTLATATTLWLLLVAPGAVKRCRRKRRGACLACGYDLRGLGKDAMCPECGT